MLYHHAILAGRRAECAIITFVDSDLGTLGQFQFKPTRTAPIITSAAFPASSKAMPPRLSGASIFVRGNSEADAGAGTGDKIAFHDERPPFDKIKSDMVILIENQH